jgi:HAD superfamily hydrolase (TIGR01509 family)
MMAPGAVLDEAVERFHSYHEEHHGRAVKVIEGIADAIDQARSLGWKVGVFTGKGRRPAEFSLVELGLRDRIEHLVSGSDVTRPKPDPEGVFIASKALGVPVDRILLAGDSTADIEAGRGAGSKTAAVLWAAFRPDRLREAGADFVCERVADLVEAVRDLNANG